LHLRRSILLSCSLAAAAMVLSSCRTIATLTSRHRDTPRPCRAVDVATLDHQHFLRVRAHATTGGHPQWRALVKLPFVGDTTLIVPVTDSATCVRGVRAFNSVVELSDSAVTEIEIIRVDSVYVVSHPLVRSGEFTFRYVFDPAFRFLDAYFN
jgi:hypothetical protein